MTWTPALFEVVTERKGRQKCLDLKLLPVGGNKEMGRNREERTEHMKREWRDENVVDLRGKEEGKRTQSVKVEASSLGCLLFGLTFRRSALIHLYLFTSLKSSCLHKLFLPFPCCLTLSCFFLRLSPLSLSFSCWLEICKACSSAPASVNPLPKHLSNARNLEMLKKNTTRRQRQQLFLTLGSYWQEWPHLEMCVCVFHK